MTTAEKQAMLVRYNPDEQCAHCKLSLPEHYIFSYFNKDSYSSNYFVVRRANLRALVWKSRQLSDRVGEPALQVLEDDLGGLYTVCSATRSPATGEWYWICRPMGPKNPCSEDWLRNISS
jgi:hypothetical protein